MVKFLSQYSRWIIAAMGFLVFGLTQTQWLTSLALWQKDEGELIDNRYLLRGQRLPDPELPDPDVALVGIQNSSVKIDDQLSPEEIAASPTLQLMQHPWPWDRRVYAAVLDKLMNSGAKVVMFDFVFASETEGDNDFAQALLKYKDHVLIGEDFADEEGPNHENIVTLTTPNDRLLLPGSESVVGLVNISGDSDETIRHAKYHTSIEREHGLSGYPDNLIHISVMAVKKFTGKTIMPPDEPVNYIDFQGKPGTYRSLAVEKMFVEHMWTNPPFSGGMTFSNKIVIVGPMTEILHDIHPTPFGEMPGPEIQAQILAALLHGSWLTRTSLLTNLVIALVMLLLALGICLLVSNALWKVFALVASVAVFFVACQIAFTHYKLVLPMMQPLFCLIVPGAFGVVFQYALEQFERMRYRNVLSRYVSANVAKVILEDKRSLEDSMRGQKKPVTILFSDIRGFTSMTESTDADKLVAQLNEYFGEMVDVIQEKNSGTLQKFIGDAIMAAWGDTHSFGVEVDAKRAVSAALQMRSALVKLNGGWKDNPDRRILATGIGVNHGEVVYGNIGAQQRMELTVLGDGVNLAARLESATKQFHTDILIGEGTEKLTREHFIYRNVGAIAFKGKTKPIEVFTLLGDRSQPAPGWLAAYHGAIKLYRSRQFEKALALLREASNGIGGGDFLCEMYVERCNACVQQPPPADWDGSFTLTEK
jgi:adenylate cyclase